MATYVTDADIAAELKARLDGDKTQKALATEMGISQAYLCDFLQGRRGAGKSILTALGYEPVRYYRKPRK